MRKLNFLIAISIFISPVLLADSAEILLGERLFLEQRFSKFYYSQAENLNDFNSPLKAGDPSLDKTVRFFGLPPYQIPFTKSPFKGGAFSCRSCHMVDEHLSQKELGMRSYADFASKSPIPSSKNNTSVTVRNSPVLVSSITERENFLLHYDGEFSNSIDLIISTLTDSNFGWDKIDYKLARNHICNVIKNDNGNNHFSSVIPTYSYTELFSGNTASGKQLPTEYLIKESKRVDVKSVACDKIIRQVAVFIDLYMEDLAFAKDENIISPYDQFLKINNLPDQPLPDETNSEYSRRLLELLTHLELENKLSYVTANPNTDGEFKYHDQAYKFTEQELIGLKIFFTQNSKSKGSQGNCVACHPAPHFSDFGLHNIGITQVEYEAIHGQNSFLSLPIPTLEDRNKHADTFLPASNNNPYRQGIYRQAATQRTTMATDLGAWNILYNDDFPKPQAAIKNLICLDETDCSNDARILDLSIATFKTPILRNLGHSAPYMHNGQISDLHAVIGFYVASSNSSRQGLIRNSDKELDNIQLSINDIQPLVDFLISLYEDYE